MSVFRDVIMIWQDVEYTVTPSNRLLRRIEGEGISLAHMISRVSDGQPPISEVSYVVAELLKSAGAEVTEDDVYREIMISLSEGNEQAFADLAISVIEAIDPKEPDAKKQKAPRRKAPVQGRGETQKIDWDTMYLLARSWGIQPSEFWEMTLPEWFLLFEMNRERDEGDYAGTLTRADVERLTKLAEGD